MPTWQAYFIRKNRESQFCLKEEYRKRVQFVQQDIRNEQPDSSFDLILCRNLVFTYFSRELQEEIARKILTRLEPCGVLVTGVHEALPKSLQGLFPGSRDRKFTAEKFKI
ncbi:MAG: CheR family methyltransferase [Desulfobulbaceae bacterium]